MINYALQAAVASLMDAPSKFGSTRMKHRVYLNSDADRGDYQLDSGIYSVSSVRIKWEDASDYSPLNYVNQAQFTQLDIQGTALYGRANIGISGYTLEHRKLSIFPVPDESVARGIEILAYVMPSLPMTASLEDELPWPVEMTRAIVARAALMALPPPRREDVFMISEQEARAVLYYEQWLVGSSSDIPPGMTAEGSLGHS